MITISKEFKQFLKDEGVHFMFSMLPKPMQQEIYNKFLELKENENEH